jgi:hypothetical protein
MGYCEHSNEPFSSIKGGELLLLASQGPCPIELVKGNQRLKVPTYFTLQARLGICGALPPWSSMPSCLL